MTLTFVGAGALAMLGISVLLFLAASAVMPGYSFVRNTISESAAQGVPRAWIGRVGFVTFGLGVLLSCLTCRASWNPASSCSWLRSEC